jgi:predicted ribosomally synthesized six-cysteine peptide SCIFF
LGKHIRTINKRVRQLQQKVACGECQTSCQSACKTSCTVGNQVCMEKRSEVGGQKSGARSQKAEARG